MADRASTPSTAAPKIVWRKPKASAINPPPAVAAINAPPLIKFNSPIARPLPFAPTSTESLCVFAWTTSARVGRSPQRTLDPMLRSHPRPHFLSIGPLKGNGLGQYGRHSLVFRRSNERRSSCVITRGSAAAKSPPPWRLPRRRWSDCWPAVEYLCTRC